MMTVVPGDLAELALDAVELVAVVHRDAGRRAPTPSYFSGSSVTITSLRDALGRAGSCMICSTEWPSGRSPTCWPPVIATASL